MDERPVLTKRLVRHVNGGSKFSSLTQQIYADDKDSGVTLHTETDGSPDYHYTGRVLSCGEDLLDLMIPGHEDPIKWILRHLSQRK